MPALYTSPSSPFGRKIKIALAVLGLAERYTLITTDTIDPAPDFLLANPLGKIPALKLDDGTTLFDSRVILEHLDGVAGGGRILPADGRRFPALRLQALADGIIDAGILRVYEARFRPEDKRHAPWTERQAAKMARALDALESAPPPAVNGLPDVGQISLAAALGWADFRFNGEWRGGRPKLVAWFEGFRAAVPAFDDSAPK